MPWIERVALGAHLEGCNDKPPLGETDAVGRYRGRHLLWVPVNMGPHQAPYHWAPGDAFRGVGGGRGEQHPDYRLREVGRHMQWGNDHT